MVSPNPSPSAPGSSVTPLVYASTLYAYSGRLWVMPGVAAPPIPSGYQVYPCRAFPIGETAIARRVSGGGQPPIYNACSQAICPGGPADNRAPTPEDTFASVMFFVGYIDWTPTNEVIVVQKAGQPDVSLLLLDPGLDVPTQLDARTGPLPAAPDRFHIFEAKLPAPSGPGSVDRLVAVPVL
jgi:hypothetical protein